MDELIALEEIVRLEQRLSTPSPTDVQTVPVQLPHTPLQRLDMVLRAWATPADTPADIDAQRTHLLQHPQELHAWYQLMVTGIADARFFGVGSTWTDFSPL